MEYADKKILVFGWAKSGKAIAQLLLQKKAKVFVYDDNRIEDLIPEVQLFDGVLDDSFKLMVKNPGISYENKLVQKALELKIPIYTEVQIALDDFKGDLIAITGSNGKTTSSILIYKMLVEGGFNFDLGGNIGTPVSQLMQKNPINLVLELSSFQLLGAEYIKPKIALVTNIFSSHLDYHKTRENYIQAKFKITQNQSNEDLLIINDDSVDLKQWVNETKAQVKYFSYQKEVNGAYFKNGFLFFEKEKIIDQSDILLKGRANFENIAAAVAVAKSYGVSNDAIIKVLTTFSGVEHRLEFVGDFNGRKIYNDSKATDIEATQSALDSFPDDDIFWIAGGLDRGDDFSKLIPNLKKVSKAVFIGETKNKLLDVALKININDVQIADNLGEAVNIASKNSKTNQIILFSPAAASWDQYPNFEIRGEEFKKMVNGVNW